MPTEIILTRQREYIICALCVDYKIIEFQCISMKEKSFVGNIYLGKVKNIVKNINGAFVEFQKGEIGFLPMRNKQIKVDDEILVQIKKEATEEKQPLLSEQIELTGKYVVLTSDKASVGISNKIQNKDTRKYLQSMTQPLITENYGFILRTRAANAAKDVVTEEAKELSDRYERILSKSLYLKPFQLVESNHNMKDMMLFGLDKDQLKQVITDQPELAEVFREDGIPVTLLSEEAKDIERRYRVMHYLKEALSKKVWMKSGGFLYIEHTEAMTVIDVNTGKSIGKGKKAKHIRETNLEAAKEIARQIRLRNLSGIIIVDFIDMKSEEDQADLLKTMQKYLNQDSKKAAAIDMTKLGLMEITRKKERNPLFKQIKLDMLKSD